MRRAATTSSTSRLSRGLAVALVLVAASPAAAQPGPAGPAAGAERSAGDRAVEAGQRGLAAFQEGQWMEAHARFAEANALSASPVFVLYMARSLRNAGRLLEARRHYRKLVDSSVADDSPSSWRHAQVDGKAELAALDRAVPSMVIEVRGASAFVVTVNGSAAPAGQGVELDPGNHRVQARAGSRQAEAMVELKEGMRATPVIVDLTPPGGPRPDTRRPSTAPAALPRSGHLLVEVDVGPALTASFGGQMGSDGIGAGALAFAHGAYELASGASFGLDVGGLLMSQSIEARPFALVPTGEQADEGSLDHDLALRMALVGGSAGVRFGDGIAARLRLGAGLAFGSVRDARRGTFQGDTGQYDTPELQHASATSCFYVAPEARIGVRLARRFEASAGLSVLTLLSLSRARWQDDQQVATGPSGAASFPEEDLTGGVIVVISPSVGVRYDF